MGHFSSDRFNRRVSCRRIHLSRFACTQQGIDDMATASLLLIFYIVYVFGNWVGRQKAKASSPPVAYLNNNYYCAIFATPKA